MCGLEPAAEKQEVVFPENETVGVSLML